MIALVLTLLENYLILTAVGFKPEFLLYYLINLAIVYCAWFVIYEGNDSSVAKFCSIANGVLVAVIIVILLGGLFFNSPIFNSGAYYQCISVENHEESDLEGNIPDLADVGKVSLMDTKSAEKLGDRTLGTLSDLVSQYKVGDYYTICVKGEIKKIAPLEYSGFFKWVNNDSIPGYVIVDPLTSEAEYVPVEKGIHYAPSAYFGKNLMRKFRNSKPFEYFGDYSFQIDDEGVPYWVITTMQANSGWLNKVPKGAGIMNAITGEIEWYNTIEKIPEWVDLVYSGDEITKLYNRHGRYINGFFNFAATGVTQVTEDFGYLAMDDDVYVYTGITSVSSDESNLGFILVNTRTGVFDYYQTAGAEEYSAMGAAEGIVQNFGYQASFPSLIMVEGNPTYVMVLKDQNGLVKQYAMVNYKNYTIAVVAETLNACTTGYLKALAGEVEIEASEGNVIVTKVEFVVENGQTYCYLAGTDGFIYKAEFLPKQLLIEVGQEISTNGYSVVE